jgi:hypothetical protein
MVLKLYFVIDDLGEMVGLVTSRSWRALIDAVEEVL